MLPGLRLALLLLAAAKIFNSQLLDILINLYGKNLLHSAFFCHVL
jgi:hypothetical protein